MAQRPYSASKHTLKLTHTHTCTHVHTITHSQCTHYHTLTMHTLSHTMHTPGLTRIHYHTHTHYCTHMHCHTCSHTTYAHSLTSTHNHKLSQAGPKFAEQPKLPCSPPRDSHQLLPYLTDSGKSLLDAHVFSSILPLLNLKK